MKSYRVPAMRTPLIHIYCGLPASGKTTAAKELAAQAAGMMRRVNLDDLRAMLDPPAPNGRPLWSHAHEHTTETIQIAAIRAAVLDGYDVVIDDTNLRPHNPTRIKNAVGRIAWFVVHDLTTVPIEECIRRDAQRTDPVGERVIRNMAADHAEALASGWPGLTSEWMNDQHAAAAGGVRWARTYLTAPTDEDDAA